MVPRIVFLQDFVGDKDAFPPEIERNLLYYVPGKIFHSTFSNQLSCDESLHLASMGKQIVIAFLKALIKLD